MILAILTAVFGAVDAVLLVVLIVICRNKRRQRGKEIEAGTKTFFEFRRLSRTLIIYTNGYKPYYSVYVFASKNSSLPYSLWIAYVPCHWILGILIKEDSDGSENGKKAKKHLV